ncbi:MAG: hypothetical protein J5993_01500 [Clostridia bacterium]|nr:hypothetical protein [Clostridia bacterium]
MKALFSLLAFLFPFASAETETYAYISTNDVYLYADAQGENGLFLLPETYYVLVLDVGRDYCLVSYGADTEDYPALVGYVKSDLLTFVDYVPSRPYALCSFTLNYVLDGAPVDGSLSTYRVQATYYGDYFIGSTAYCYVYAGKFGYVARPDLTIERNTDFPAEEQPTEPSEQFSVPTAVVFVLFALFTVVTLCFALKSGKKQQTGDWYEVT